MMVLRLYTLEIQVIPDTIGSFIIRKRQGKYTTEGSRFICGKSEVLPAFSLTFGVLCEGDDVTERSLNPLKRLTNDLE
ncbi:hypothetical protein AAFF_G00377320 [Aldrovandia affinis]|uniref:Uncharacterized protein n=1 Tax=Aldrovandia affinis TaxID=143900 RepID=A0AAD7SFT3_9TELE|nr:hypothetical protein AAFF_G00377320 [Aldrovandia affinis]